MGQKLSLIDKLFIGILLVIFGGIVLHAPLSVGFSTLWPDFSLIIKSWKEVLLGVALVFAIIIVTRQKRWDIIRSKVMYTIAGFAALCLLLIPLHFTGFESTVAGLFINLRFLLFFVLVYVALRLYPQYYKAFIYTFIGGALVVVGFGLLQLTVLPHDILAHIGYGKATIMPYLTVDQNMNYIRINSTLRGPNPLGAYAVVVLAVLLALWLRGPRKLKNRELWAVFLLGIGSLAILWASYARSAALAALVAIAMVLFVAYGRRLTRGLWIGLAAVALIIGGSLVVFRDTQFVSQVILHEDPHEGGTVNSNDGHAESLRDGTERMLQQPLGAGIGSTGSASLVSDSPVIIENHYLFIAHETGWLGLGLFLVITYFVLTGLWRRRRHWLALGAFASGLGLAFAALVLPVWADDTVSIIWWGLAAVALAMPMDASKPAPNKKVRHKNG